MKEAVAEYEKLGQDKLSELGLTDNLAFALFYSGDFAGAYKAAQALNPEPKALLPRAWPCSRAARPGLDEANKRATDDNGFKETAHTAGEMLMNMRQYPQAADFFQAGAGGDDAARSIGSGEHAARRAASRGCAVREHACRYRQALLPGSFRSRSHDRPASPPCSAETRVKVLNAEDADELKEGSARTARN